MWLGDFDEAQTDLTALERAAGSDTQLLDYVRGARERISKLEEAKTQADRSLFRNMFGSGAHSSSSWAQHVLTIEEYTSFTKNSYVRVLVSHKQYTSIYSYILRGYTVALTALSNRISSLPLFLLATFIIYYFYFSSHLQITNPLHFRLNLRSSVVECEYRSAVNYCRMQ